MSSLSVLLCFLEDCQGRFLGEAWCFGVTFCVLRAGFVAGGLR